MLKQQGFEVLIADDQDHERLFCEIYYNGFFFALVSQERGDGLFDLEIQNSDNHKERTIQKVDLLEFQKVVEKACRRLKGDES